MALKTKKKAKKEPTAAERANQAAGKGAGAEKKADAKKAEKKGKPKSDKLAVAETPLEILPVLTEDEKKQKAVEDDARFRELETSTRKNFVEMGMILREIKAYELHKYMTNKQGKKFTSFDTWLKDAAPLSRAGGYAALKAMERLLPIIPKKELEEYPRYSVELMAKLPKLHLENPVIREAAKTQSKKKLVETINKEAPDAHIESKKTVTVDASAAPIILDAFTAAENLGEVDEAHALEYICTDWMDSPCQIEQYAGMSNRQAWEAWKTTQPEAVAARVTEGEDEEMGDVSGISDAIHKFADDKRNLDADEVEQPA